MEPENLLLPSQRPTTGPYADPDASSPQLPTLFPKIRPNIFPSMPRSSEWYFPFRFSEQNFVCISHLSRACYMLRSSNESFKLSVN